MFYWIANTKPIAYVSSQKSNGTVVVTSINILLEKSTSIHVVTTQVRWNFTNVILPLDAKCLLSLTLIRPSINLAYYIF